MLTYVENLLWAMRPAFSRRAAFAWFVVVFVGFVLRGDALGVSSVVRALSLPPSAYLGLLHFFHSTAWEGPALLACWWRWLAAQPVVLRVGPRIVLLGDHTKTPKGGRRMPEVTTLHQDSETASKPSFFRGHQWGCLSLLVGAAHKYFAAPLWAEIHRESLPESQTTRIVAVAADIARVLGHSAYLVLDAFFAAGPVFELAARSGNLHILTRAKRNVVAYEPPAQPKKRRRGRPRRYGTKRKLTPLFDRWAAKFQTARATVYRQPETVRYMALNLIWKPIRRTLRFILIESSRGRIILMTSDLTLDPLVALELYTRRVRIETLFDALKNILGALRYHFWSRYLEPTSRRPKRNASKPASSEPHKTANTLAAIEKFVLVQLIVLGSLHLLALRYASHIRTKARCWLRTPTAEIPSEFVTRQALANTLRENIIRFAPSWIIAIILHTQGKRRQAASSRRVG
jgi:hypothetical protein